MNELRLKCSEVGRYPCTCIIISCLQHYSYIYNNFSKHNKTKTKAFILRIKCIFVLIAVTFSILSMINESSDFWVNFYSVLVGYFHSYSPIQLLQRTDHLIVLRKLIPHYSSTALLVLHHFESIVLEVSLARLLFLVG